MPPAEAAAGGETAGELGAGFVEFDATALHRCNAEAAQQAYDAIGVEHAPQREGAPTDKATVERSFGTVKTALAPIFDVLNRIAAAMPALRRPADRRARARSSPRSPLVHHRCPGRVAARPGRAAVVMPELRRCLGSIAAAPARPDFRNGH